MSARKVVLHARMEYSLWLTNPRMSILLVLLGLIHSMVNQPLAQSGGQMGNDSTCWSPWPLCAIPH